MKYQDKSGRSTTATDPGRLIWYSAHCGYWTDDWSLLKTIGPGIPCCPVCSCPGMQTSAGDWETGAKNFDTEQPGYLAFLNGHKAHCFGKTGMMKAWEMARPTGQEEGG